MSAVTRHLRRALFPGVVFIAGLAAHYLWSVLFHDQGPVQGQWAMMPAKTSGIQSYIESQGYWIGYSYALSLGFAASALRRYRELRCCTARTLAVGGLSLSGILAAGGCFLLGCCGSPMLVVWTTLFGAGFLPFTKPFVAALTTTSIGAAWWWMPMEALTAGAAGPEKKVSGPETSITEGAGANAGNLSRSAQN